MDPAAESEELELITHFLVTGELPAGDSEQKKIRKAAHKHCLLDGRLHNGITDPKRVVLDPEERGSLIRQLHCGQSPANGPLLRHQSLKTCVKILTHNEKVFWPRMGFDVAEFIRCCPLCTQRGMVGRRKAVPLSDDDEEERDDDDDDEVDSDDFGENVGGAVWKSTHVHVHGPFLDRKYVFTIRDPVSRWVVARGFDLDVHSDMLGSLAQFVFSSLCQYGFAQCRVHLQSEKEFHAVRDLVTARAQTIDSLTKVERMLPAAEFLEHSQDSCCTRLGAELAELVTQDDDWEGGLDSWLFGQRIKVQSFGRTSFSMLFNRDPLGGLCDNNDVGGDAGQDPPQVIGLSRRSLKSSRLLCRHCDDVFTSRISFKLHQKRHLEQAKKSGAMKGEEMCGADWGTVGDQDHLDGDDFDANYEERQRRQKNRRGHSKKNPKTKFDPATRIAQLTESTAGRLASAGTRKRKRKKKPAIEKEFKDPSEVKDVAESTISAMKKLLVETREARSKRGKYAKFSPELQDEIAEHALRHGVAATVAYYGERFEHNTLTTSSVRNFVRGLKLYPPVLKEEVGRCAYQYGPDRALEAYRKKRPELDLNRATVKRFKTYFLNRHPNLIDNDAADGDDDDITADTDSRMAVFGPALRDEIGRHAFQFGNVPAVEHFSAKLQFPMQESTVRKFKRAWMTNNSIVETAMTAADAKADNGVQQHFITVEMSEDQEAASELMASSVALNMIQTQNENAIGFTTTGEGVHQQQQYVEGQILLATAPQQHQQSFVVGPSQIPFEQQHQNFILTGASGSGSGNRDLSSVTSTSGSQQQYAYIPHQQSAAAGQISAPLSLTINQRELVNLSSSAPQDHSFKVHQDVVQTEQGPVPILVQNQGETADQTTTTLTVTLQQHGEKDDGTGLLQIDDPDSPDQEEENEVENVAVKMSSRGRLVKRKVPSAVSKPPRSKGTKRPPALQPNQLTSTCERGKKRAYTTYDPELRAKVGRYALDHGNQETIDHFHDECGIDLPESTVRGLRDRYLLKMSKEKDGGSGGEVLDYGRRGRPMLLGKYDAVVKDCIRQLTESGSETVSSFLVIATAKQVLMQREPELLAENGGSVELNPTWAKSFLRRNKIRLGGGKKGSTAPEAEAKD